MRTQRFRVNCSPNTPKSLQTLLKMRVISSNDDGHIHLYKPYQFDVYTKGDVISGPAGVKGHKILQWGQQLWAISCTAGIPITECSYFQESFPLRLFLRCTFIQSHRRKQQYSDECDSNSIKYRSVNVPINIRFELYPNFIGEGDVRTVI